MSPIEKFKGPCVVLAGAGTGKTTTIVEKAKHLIMEGIYNPERIVCITFSNEAANNLARKIRKFIDSEKEPIVRTFHAFSGDLLRKYGSKIGLNENFRILTPDEAKVLLHKSFKVSPNLCRKYINSINSAKDLGISIGKVNIFLEKKLENYKGVDLQKRLENLSFQLHTLHLGKERFSKKELLDEISNLKTIISLNDLISKWNSYEKLKKKMNYQDYSDLGQNALFLLRENKDINIDFDYVIVDEFQDTNKVQLDFLIELANHRNITVVGDLNQSIYRFRGAYKENFSEFKKHFGVSEEDIFNLDKSFRSPNKVLRNAYKLILNNYKNKDECFNVENSHNREGESIEVYELTDAKEEARKVVELVKRELERGVPSDKICVMYRNHQQGRIIRKALELANINYCSVSRNSLLKNPSVRRVVSYLSVLDRLNRKKKGGEGDWWELFYSYGFSEEDLIKLGRFIKEKKGSENLSFEIFNSLDKLPLSLSGRVIAMHVTQVLDGILPVVSEGATKIVRNIYDACGISGESENRASSSNLYKFYETVQNYASLYSDDLSGFVDYLEALDKLGIDIEEAGSERDGIKLMTLHSTKGLEFKSVIITNMAQKRFPSERFTKDTLIPLELYPEIKGFEVKDGFESFVKEYEKENQVLDERRLCYVAFTRAEERLILTYALDYGGKKYFQSQFLNEIDYKKNADVVFYFDSDKKYVEPDVKIERADSFEKVLNAKDFELAFAKLIAESEKSERVVLNEKKSYSPSALTSFLECQKKYEYQYVYNMPEKAGASFESMQLGSFVHLVVETGVKENFKTLKEFTDLAKDLHTKEEWESVELDEAISMVRVFFERNKSKYDEKSLCEVWLRTSFDGIGFSGKADRIDFSDSGIEVIDYKTGKWFPNPINRNFQLGYYALAAAEKYGKKVRKITIDMLRQEKPLEFELDEGGNAQAVYGKIGFNIYEVKNELVKTARAISEAHKSGFKPCSIEKNCDFCNEYVHGL